MCEKINKNIIHIKFFLLPPPTFPPFPIHILHCKQKWVSYMLFCSGRSLFLAMFQSLYLYLVLEVILILSIKIKGYYQLSRNMLALKLLIYWELSSQIWLEWEPYRLQALAFYYYSSTLLGYSLPAKRKLNQNLNVYLYYSWTWIRDHTQTNKFKQTRCPQHNGIHIIHVRDHTQTETFGSHF